MKVLVDEVLVDETSGSIRIKIKAYKGSMWVSFNNSGIVEYGSMITKNLSLITSSQILNNQTECLKALQTKTYTLLCTTNKYHRSPIPKHQRTQLLIHENRKKLKGSQFMDSFSCSYSIYIYIWRHEHEHIIKS